MRNKVLGSEKLALEKYSVVYKKIGRKQYFMNKIPFLISYVSGKKYYLDPIVGECFTNEYTDCLVYATSITDMYKRMKKEKGISKSKIILKTIL